MRLILEYTGKLTDPPPEIIIPVMVDSRPINATLVLRRTGGNSKGDNVTRRFEVVDLLVNVRRDRTDPFRRDP